MYRLFGCLAALGIFALAPAAQAARPDGAGQSKVLIAHLAETETETLVEIVDGVEVVTEVTTYRYNVISVAAPAVDAHLAHGDVLIGDELPDGSIAAGEKGDKIVVEVSTEVAPPPAP